MRCLILPDVHEKVIWKKHIQEYFDSVDNVYFVGDYFDNHDDSDVIGEQAVKNFEEIIQLKKDNSEKVHLCLGNHDLHYLFFTYPGSGFQEKYSNIYRKVLIENSDYLEMVCEIPNIRWNEEPIYVSHAGVSEAWYGMLKASIFGTMQISGETLRDLDIINNTFNFAMQLQKKCLQGSLTDDEKIVAETAIGMFMFPAASLDPFGDDVICPPTWIRPNALLSCPYFNNQIVGHTILDIKPDAQYLPLRLKKDTGVTHGVQVIFVDSLQHDKILLLDEKVQIDWIDLKKEEKESRDAK